MASIAPSGMSAALARIQEIQAQVAPPAPPSASAGNFASALASAQAPAPGTQVANALTGYSTPALPYGSTPVGTPGAVGHVAVGSGSPVGQQIAQLAVAELGVAESPPGSNDGPRIAEYRKATAGAGVGPWCSYFTSWLAASAGVPVGHQGQGLGWVPDVSQWGKDTGRWIPAQGGTPAVGDLVIFDRNGDGLHDHIGVVTNVRPDGSFETVEGNSSDEVSARSYAAGGAAGFVRPG